MHMPESMPQNKSVEFHQRAAEAARAGLESLTRQANERLHSARRSAIKQGKTHPARTAAALVMPTGTIIVAVTALSMKAAVRALTRAFHNAEVATQREKQDIPPIFDMPASPIRVRFQEQDIKPILQEIERGLMSSDSKEKSTALKRLGYLLDDVGYKVFSKAENYRLIEGILFPKAKLDAAERLKKEITDAKADRSEHKKEVIKLREKIKRLQVKISKQSVGVGTEKYQKTIRSYEGKIIKHEKQIKSTSKKIDKVASERLHLKAELDWYNDNGKLIKPLQQKFEEKIEMAMRMNLIDQMLLGPEASDKSWDQLLYGFRSVLTTEALLESIAEMAENPLLTENDKIKLLQFCCNLIDCRQYDKDFKENVNAKLIDIIQSTILGSLEGKLVEGISSKIDNAKNILIRLQGDPRVHGFFQEFKEQGFFFQNNSIGNLIELVNAMSHEEFSINRVAIHELIGRLENYISAEEFALDQFLSPSLRDLKKTVVAKEVNNCSFHEVIDYKDSKESARKLSLALSYLESLVDAEEIMAFTKGKDTATLAPMLSQLKTVTQNITASIIDDIMSGKVLSGLEDDILNDKVLVNDKERAECLKEAKRKYHFYLKVANQALKDGDAGTALAIYLALKANSIDRLLFQNSKKNEKYHNKLEQTLSPVGSFKELRNFMKEHPGMPCPIALTIKDLTPMGEIEARTGGDPNDGTVPAREFNSGKIETVAKIIKGEADRITSLKSKIKDSVGVVPSCFLIYTPRDSNDLYKLSLFVVPKKPTTPVA